MPNPDAASILIKRDAAAKLYDVDLARYVGVDDLFAWQVLAVPFIVRDATSGEDITAAVLADPTAPILTHPGGNRPWHGL
jgi:polyhydroxyalkanoate synthesis regulator protein